MKVEATNYGKCVYVWNEGYSDDWKYQIRNVKVLNAGFKQHPFIEELAKQEAKLEKKLMERLEEMDALHHRAFEGENLENYNRVFDEWIAAHPGIEYNEYFHDTIDYLIERINAISDKYCRIARENGYSWCY